MENNARNLPEVATGTVRDAVNHFAPRYDNQCYQLFRYYLAKNHTKIAIFRYDQPPKTPKNSERKTFSCPKCNKAFPILTLLQNHVNACLDQD